MINGDDEYVLNFKNGQVNKSVIHYARKSLTGNEAVDWGWRHGPQILAYLIIRYIDDTVNG